jgi:murein DD-endopeptidase MepM/ murein hydrolase activator NlpD
VVGVTSRAIGGGILRAARGRGTPTSRFPLPPRSLQLEPDRGPDRLRVLLASVLALALTVGLQWSPIGVGADEKIDDLRRQREAARDAAATAVAELEALELEDAELAQALVDLEQTIEAQVARIDGARQALSAAEAEVLTREGLVVEKLAETTALEAEVARRVVESYVGEADHTLDWLSSEDLNRTSVQLSLIEFSFGGDRQAFDELRRARAELEQHLAEGQRARDDARVLSARLETELADLEEQMAIKRILQEEIRVRMVEWEQAAADLAREAAEFTELIRRTQVETLGFDLSDPGAASVQGFVMPVSGSIGSGFGERRHPIFGTVRMHNGVDLSGDAGDPVWAAKEGVIIYAGWRGGYGNTIVVQHAGNVATLYAHLLEIDVTVGNWVGEAEVMGLVGSTGWSTGPHLHFEVRRDGVPEDPELYLPI